MLIFSLDERTAFVSSTVETAASMPRYASKNPALYAGFNF
jgi:hypothetical protein